MRLPAKLLGLRLRFARTDPRYLAGLYLYASGTQRRVLATNRQALIAVTWDEPVNYAEPLACVVPAQTRRALWRMASAVGAKSCKVSVLADSSLHCVLESPSSRHEVTVPAAALPPAPLLAVLAETEGSERPIAPGTAIAVDLLQVALRDLQRLGVGSILLGAQARDRLRPDDPAGNGCTLFSSWINLGLTEGTGERALVRLLVMPTATESGALAATLPPFLIAIGHPVPRQHLVQLVEVLPGAWLRVQELQPASATGVPTGRCFVVKLRAIADAGDRQRVQELVAAEAAQRQVVWESDGMPAVDAVLPEPITRGAVQDGHTQGTGQTEDGKFTPGATADPRGE